MKAIRMLGIFNQIWRLFIKEKIKEKKNLELYLDLANRNPKDAKHQLKLAEIYHKNGEEKKALSELLLAAENLCNTGHYRKGLAIYKTILKKQPYRNDLRLKIATIYKEMGFSKEAFSQYYRLYKYFIFMGLKYKASEILNFMAELNPQKFTIDEARSLRSGELEKGLKSQKENANVSNTNLQQLGQKGMEPFFDLAREMESGGAVNLDGPKSVRMDEDFGSEDIIKEIIKDVDVEKIYPNINYQMGFAYKELGSIDEALGQFRIALEKNQKPIESAKLMDFCRS